MRDARKVAGALTLLFLALAVCAHAAGQLDVATDFYSTATLTAAVWVALLVFDPPEDGPWRYP